MSLRRGLVAIMTCLLLVSTVGISAATESDPLAVERVDPMTLAAPERAPIDFVPRGVDPDASVSVFVHFAGKPVMAAYAQARAQGRRLTTADQKVLRARLDVNQKRAAKVVQAAGGRVDFTYKNALNAIAIRIKRSELSRIASLPYVTKITPVQVIELQNESSIPFIGVPAVHAMAVGGVNVTGKGIRIAVIDTGIDYIHKNFGGSGTQADYDANDPDIVEPGTFPTAKVVGGYDLAGDEYDANSLDPAVNTPVPDPDPMDFRSHGTHVSGTIAGLGVEGKIGAGVAPDALLYVYKVFGTNGSTMLTAAGIEMAMDPNQDGNVDDHVDVINMSLGAAFGSTEDGTSMAAQAAADAGIIVVASAGNEGNVPYITGSPAVADGVISVAASVDDGIIHGAVRVHSPEAIKGDYEAAEGAITRPLGEAGPITNDIVYIGQGCNADTYQGDPSGKIALADRGTCSFAEKILRAQSSGAVAVIMANNQPGDPIIMGGSPDGITIPGVMVSKTTGATLKGAGQTVNVTLSAELSYPRPDLADTLTSFTSRGPGRTGGFFKPDIAAPGQDILSSVAGTGDGGELYSGTSMAAPHVTGVAALMRQLHPDWTVPEIKALLMNTATPTRTLSGAEYPLSLQGTGRVQADKAALATAIATPAGIGLGHLAVTSTTTVTRTITVTNKGNADKTFALTAGFVGNAWGTTATLSRTSLTVPAGGSDSFDLTLTFDAAGLPDPTKSANAFVEVGGRLRLTAAEGDELVVGFHATPEKASDAYIRVPGAKVGLQPDLNRALSNTGAGPGTVTLFALGATDEADGDVHPEGDIRLVGAREVQDRLEFAVVLDRAANTQAINEVDILVDTNQDGNPEFDVFSYDLGYVTAGAYNGQPASFVYDLNTGDVWPEYYLPVAYRYNSRAVVLPVTKDSLAISGETKFNWTVYTFPADGGSDFIDHWMTFQRGAAGANASPSTGKQAGNPFELLVLFPFNAPENQAQVISVGK